MAKLYPPHTPSQNKAEGLRLWDYNFVSLFWVNTAGDLYFVFQNILKELGLGLWSPHLLLVLNSGSILDPEIFLGETGQCFLVKNVTSDNLTFLGRQLHSQILKYIVRKIMPSLLAMITNKALLGYRDHWKPWCFKNLKSSVDHQR